MMVRSSLLGFWDQLRQRHGIALRTLALIPDAQLNEHPIRDMRTPAEVATHVYTLMKEVAEGVTRGEIRKYGEGYVPVASTAELVKYAESCWAAADAAVKSITDAQLAATVQTPWGMAFPGWVCFGILNDEFLHHRGQLYAYVRQMGAAPPMMWDFGGNAPAYRPGAAQSA